VCEADAMDEDFYVFSVCYSARSTVCSRSFRVTSNPPQPRLAVVRHGSREVRLVADFDRSPRFPCTSRKCRP